MPTTPEIKSPVPPLIRETNPLISLHWEKLVEKSAEDDGAKKLLQVLQAKTEHEAFIKAVFAGSPFLANLIIEQPDIALAALEGNHEQAFSEICASLKAEDVEDEDTLSRNLRTAKAQAALLIGLCDLRKTWPLLEVTSALTKFADSCLKACLEFFAHAGESEKSAH